MLCFGSDLGMRVFLIHFTNYDYISHKKLLSFLGNALLGSWTTEVGLGSPPLNALTAISQQRDRNGDYHAKLGIDSGERNWILHCCSREDQVLFFYHFFLCFLDRPSKPSLSFSVEIPTFSNLPLSKDSLV